MGQISRSTERISSFRDNLLLSPTVKEFSKSVNILMMLSQNVRQHVFFWDTVYFTLLQNGHKISPHYCWACYFHLYLRVTTKSLLENAWDIRRWVKKEQKIGWHQNIMHSSAWPKSLQMCFDVEQRSSEILTWCLPYINDICNNCRHQSKHWYVNKTICKYNLHCYKRLSVIHNKDKCFPEAKIPPKWLKALTKEQQYSHSEMSVKSTTLRFH